jgi:Mce-associated membrane protein
LVAAVLLVIDAGAAAAVQTARTQALRTARADVVDILSYDYRTLASDIARAKGEATGLFLQQYQTTAASLSQAVQVKAIVQATVGSAGVVSATQDQVVVLAFVDQASVKQLPTTTAPTTRIDQDRVVLTMTRVRGRWLVSNLSAL